MLNQCYFGDVMDVLPRLASRGLTVDCIVTSPPYFRQRDYGDARQIGWEASVDEYIESLVKVFRLSRELLTPRGTLWLNIGDGYWKRHFGKPPLREDGKPRLKPKDLIGVPWRLALALQADGWYLRADIIWAKPNPLPASVRDRPTCSHEYLFLLSRSPVYYYDREAIQEPAVTPEKYAKAKRFGASHSKYQSNHLSHPNLRGGQWQWSSRRNKRSVWTVATQHYPQAHFAVFPPQLIEPCILAGCPVGGIVLDPFLGSGTTAMVAQQCQRNWVGIELIPAYKLLQQQRLVQVGVRAQS